MSLTARRSLGLFAAAAVVFSACSGTATPAPTAAPTAAATPAATVAPTPAPTTAATPAPTTAATATPAPTAAGPDLFSSTYATRRTAGKAGGTVIIGDWQEANLWNPYYQGQVIEANITSAVFRGLVTSTDDFKYAVDLSVDPAPLLSNGGVKVPGDSGDAMTVTWKMKAGQLWSDGSPITCDDIAATEKWVMDPDNTGLYGGTTGYEDITAIDCPDATTAVMHFKKVYFDYLVLFPAILQKAYITTIPVKDQVTGKGWQNADMAKVPVSGPFMYDTITPKQELRLKKNPNWKNPITGETAYLDEVVFKWYGDTAAMIAGYKAGEIDHAGDLQDGDLPSVADLGSQVKPLDALQYEFLRPNWGVSGVTGKPSVMSDLAMRQALAYATDKESINTRLLGGTATIAWTNVSPFAWYYSEPTKLSFDLEKAKTVLETAGWVAGADGVRAKNGVKAEVLLCTTTKQLRQDVLALLAKSLKDIGVAAEVKPVSADDIFATYNESTKDTPCNLSRHNFDVALHTFSVPLSPNSNYPVYHTGQEAPNGQNDAQINDPTVDKILDDLKGTVDFSKGLGLMTQWQQIYVDQVVEVPLYFRKDVNLVQPYIGNWTGNPTSTGYTWNIGDWYLNK
jgi:peptide/nickel transport system substrate-binding protein